MQWICTRLLGVARRRNCRMDLAESRAVQCRIEGQVHLFAAARRRFFGDETRAMWKRRTGDVRFIFHAH